MLSLIKYFFTWISKQSMARLFSYTRQLERQLAHIDKMYIQQIAVIREENKHEASYLEKEIAELKLERQSLLDRLLARNGFKPIWHQEPEREKTKTKPYQPSYEAAIEEAETQHSNFKSMLEAAKAWKQESQELAE